jgi:hypothetical protein
MASLALVPTDAPVVGESTLIAAAFAARNAQLARENAIDHERERRRDVELQTRLSERLSAVLGVRVPAETIPVVDDWDREDRMPVVEIDGLRFSLTYRSSDSDWPWHLAVLGRCERCSHDIVNRIETLSDLGSVLAQPISLREHVYDCVTPLKADYEIVEDPVEEALKACATAWEAHGTVRAHEMLLEDQRPLIKAAAIERLMKAGKATSASAAEKIVEADDEYLAHRVKQRDAVIETQKAYGLAKAAEFRAQRLARDGSR